MLFSSIRAPGVDKAALDLSSFEDSDCILPALPVRYVAQKCAALRPDLL